ncbi:MAG: SDR family oxidoreductase [Pseudomonadales bacterium]
MQVKLDGRVAIVTGAGQGIGEGIAKVFAQSGAKVVVATRSADNGQQTVDDIVAAGGEAMLVQCDVGQRSEIERVVAATVEAWGRIDIAIHNAAIFPMHSVADMPDDVLDQTLAVNMKAAFWITQESLPFFRKQGGGRIILTSSVTGPTVAMPGTSNYAASKGGMNAFIRTAALELGRENITVNGVEPGYIMTQAMGLLADDEELKEMASLIPNGKIGVPEDIAYAMLFLASDEASYITGQTIIVDGGSTLPESPVVLRAFYEEQGQG